MIELDKKLHKEIKEYCRLNGLVMKEYVNFLLKKAFTADKFGETPFQREKEEPLNTEIPPEIAQTLPTKKDYTKMYSGVSINEEGNLVYTPPSKEEEQKLIEEGKIVLAPYTIEEAVDTVVATPETTKVESVKETKTIKKPKKRNL
jgi:hypothetical protein